MSSVPLGRKWLYLCILMMFSGSGRINVNIIELLLTFDTSFLSLQEEVVEFLTQQQLEVGMQLCGQALHGDGGQKCLL